jgi:hypothetical protein
MSWTCIVTFCPPVQMQRRPSSSGDADSEHSSGSSRGARGGEAGPLACLGAALPGDAVGGARLEEEETVDDKDARSAEAGGMHDTARPEAVL